MKPDLQTIVALLDRGDAPDSKYPDAKGEYWALCPFHSDVHSGSFSVSEHGYKCFACGAVGSLADLEQKLSIGPVARSRGASGPNTTFLLADYARAKQLPEAFLRSLGLADRKWNTQQAVRIPYRDTTGQEIASRFRIAATGDKFRWSKGSKVIPYGLDQLTGITGDIVLVEGESDAQTLWFHGIAALGIPGAATWKPAWAQLLTGLTVYVWQEPDQGGATFAAKVGASIPNCLILAAPAGRKDVSECHVAGDDVPALLVQLKAAANPFTQVQAQHTGQAAADAKKKAAALLNAPDILQEFANLCFAQGLVGEDRTLRLLYLALTSRLLDRPVSVVVKGPSSGGKSFTVETVLKAFPPSSFYALSSMSDRSLAYSEEPLIHRFLILYEAAGMAGDMATYLMRTLLSEGCIRYETVEKTSDGLKPKLIEREGPTGLIVTTTAVSLHPENETRMFSVTVKDDRAQTAGVLATLADRANGHAPAAPDFTSWHALQTWLAIEGSCDVTIPYAHELATLADARAVRLRRDFGAVLRLIKAHAILHQESRTRDAHGRIVATLADYAAVYDLVIDIVSEGVQATVKPEVREAVEAVKDLDLPGMPSVTFKRVGDKLGIDKTAAKRRCDVAIREGYLVNRQDKRNQPALLSIGDALPADVEVLPSPQKINSCVIPRATVQPCNRSVTPVTEAAEADFGAENGVKTALEDWQAALWADYARS